jgi:hypothetical protein
LQVFGEQLIQAGHTQVEFSCMLIQLIQRSRVIRQKDFGSAPLGIF